MPGGDNFDTFMAGTQGGTNTSASSNWGSSGSSNNASSGNKNNNNYDARGYAASGQAQSDYEASLPAEPQPAGLDAIIANKDKLTQIDAGNGLNQYQVEMEKFKNSPGGKELFKKKFPNPLIKMAQGLGSYFKKGGALGILFNALSGSKDAASKFTQNASTMAKDIGSLLGLDSLMTKNLSIAAGGDTADVSQFIQGQQAYDPSGLEGYRDKIMNMVAPIYGEDYIYDKSYMLPGAMEEAVLAGSEPYSNFKEQISSDASTDQQEVARDDERLDNLLVDLGIVGDQPLSSVTEEVSETDYTGGRIEQPDNPNAMMDFPKVEGTSPALDVQSNFNTIMQNPNIPYGDEMSFLDIEAEKNMANGGYMSSFPNQNLNTESLSASDNIDDRIMKNLQFEKMSPGMMGYNQGGRVMSTYDKLKAIADNNYG